MMLLRARFCLWLAKTSSALSPPKLRPQVRSKANLSSRVRVSHSPQITNLLISFVRVLCALLKPRFDLALENMALRQQVAVLKLKKPRPRMRVSDRILWMLLHRFWPKWREAPIIVKPETVIRSHREGFSKYWRWKSRTKCGGPPRTDIVIRDLVRRMASRNPTWGAPRIHGELRMLGIDVSERTVARYMSNSPVDPDGHQRWMTFLRNHRDCIAAMNFFTVPTVRFQVLYVLFIIHHAR